VTRVVFVLMPHLDLLDLAGPAQVFSTAADFGHDYARSTVEAAAHAVGFGDARMLRRLRARAVSGARAA
jgi:transcriptional regulator GlxA family with amidase domain